MTSVSTQDEDELQLSSAALEALALFLTEKEEREKEFERLRLKAEAEEQERKIITMDYFQEDWQHSQFWYHDDTATALAEELLDGAKEDALIGVVSAPSVYVKIQELKAIGRIPKNIKVHLLEFDERFNLFEDFIRYDFQQPFNLPAHLKNKFDRILLDPPFLSNDCQTKAALTVRWMTKPWTAPKKGGSSEPDPAVRIMVCTGERMRELVEKLYRPAGVRGTSFDVQHANGLSNEFMLYSSFQSERFQYLKDEI
ncbi:Protein-lysine N-methyltransferase efm5 [Rhizina undulata]